MRLYAITDRRLFPGDERERCAALLKQAQSWARAGVDFIQLREKDLAPDMLLTMASRLVEATRIEPPQGRGRTSILVNGPVAIALKAGADGVHLPAAAFGELLAAEIRLARSIGLRQVSVSCHTAEEAGAAGRAGADLLVFAPVFEKPLWDEGERADTPPGALRGTGLGALAAACARAGDVPVYALGGVSIGNAGACLEAGAAGVAGIRLLAGDGWRELIAS